MSGKITSGQTKPPQGPQEEKDSQQSNSPPQAERSLIPPSSIQGGVNIEESIASVENDRKRKREETEEKKEIEEIETPQPSKKEREVDLESKGKIKDLLEKVSECFGPLPQNINSLGPIADFCFERIGERIRRPDHLGTEEILKIHELLFETDLQSTCEPILSKPLNPVNPHPAYVFKSLYNCLVRLNGTCKQTREHYFSQHPVLNNYFEITSFGDRTPALLDALEGIQKGFIHALNGAPVYTTRELLGSDNVNPAYILHDDQQRPAWVFKPVIRKLSVEEKQMYQVPDGGSVYKKYSSGDPEELSSQVEHAAYCLNFEKQFPIPFTLRVEINGDIGSIQLFIRGQEVKIDKSVLREDIFSENLQAMLIFDLLFANCDRHLDNFLVKRLGQGEHRLYAIDHDACLQIGSGRPLKLLYLDHLSGYSIKQNLKSLFSPKAIETYKEIIKQLSIPGFEEWVRWANIVVEKLENPGQQSLKRLAEDLMKTYETNNWS